MGDIALGISGHFSVSNFLLHFSYCVLAITVLSKSLSGFSVFSSLGCQEFWFELLELQMQLLKRKRSVNTFNNFIYYCWKKPYWLPDWNIDIYNFSYAYMSQQFDPEYQDTPVVLVSPQLLIFLEASFRCQKWWWIGYIKEIWNCIVNKSVLDSSIHKLIIFKMVWT